MILTINTALPLHSKGGTEVRERHTERGQKNSLNKSQEAHQNVPFTLEIKSNLIEIQAISALHQVASKRSNQRN